MEKQITPPPMNVETIVDETGNQEAQANQPKAIPTREDIKWVPLLLYGTCTVVGFIGGPLLMKLYYMHGGNRKWLSSWLQYVGFPLFVTPFVFLYLKKLGRSKSPSAVFLMEPKLLVSSSGLGLLLGLAAYMYSVGLFYIPVSTSSLLVSTQLPFTAVFAFLLVKQKFSFYSINSVVLMTLGAVVLALHTSGDRPPGVSNGNYFLGFFFTLGAAGLLGLSMPLIELAYNKNTKPITFTVVLQSLFVINLLATIFCTVGMLINNDFKVMPREAKEYALGEVKYYVVLVTTAIVWQLSLVGMLGVIHCTSSLFTGILSAVLLPLTQVAAVIIYHDKFTGEKGMSLALCLWSLASYVIGDYKNSRKSKPIIQEGETV